MEKLKKHLKDTYQLSNYQIAQLAYVLKTFTSELSKMLIMIILFHRQLPAYLFSLFIMLFLRCSTGGLHFYTYIGCLLASITYIYFAIFILPTLLLPAFMQLLLLLLCVVVCYHIGPVVSKYRAKPSQTLFTRGRNTTCTFIFIYALILYIMPANHLMNVGFWVIILHSLQLIIAKIKKKGDGLS